MSAIITENGKQKYYTDLDGNQITLNEKLGAGFLFIFVFILCLVGIIGHWPDKMPPHDSTNGNPITTEYYYSLFHVKYKGKDGTVDNLALAVTNDQNAGQKTGGTQATPVKKPTVINNKNGSNASDSAAADSLKKKTKTENKNISGSAKDQPVATSDSLATSSDASKNKSSTKIQDKTITPDKSCIIELNTLIMLLVAMSGFLGNLIHIAASFTNFIGSGKFKRSWILWYFVKPFIASALAIGVYIIFRAGFLNTGDATPSISLYGVVGISILTGLYTDMATVKLKEVFGVIFKSEAVRPDALDLPELKITGSIPKKVPQNKNVQIILSGSGFNKRTLKLRIGDKELENVTVEPNAIIFNYTATEDKIKVTILDDKDKELATYDIETVPTPQEDQSIGTRITSIEPLVLSLNIDTPVKITGNQLNNEALTVTMGTDNIDHSQITKNASSLTFNYTSAKSGDLEVSIKDSKGNELFKKTLVVS